MHLPYSPNPMPPLTMTHSARHNKSTMTKPSYPQALESTAGSEKLPGASTSNKHYGRSAKVKTCSLKTASPKPRMNAQPLPRKTPTMQSAWQLIPLMHNVTNQLSGLPNADKIWPNTWVLRSIEPTKSLTRTNMSVLPSKTKFTYLMQIQPLASC